MSYFGQLAFPDPGAQPGDDIMKSRPGEGSECTSGLLDRYETPAIPGQLKDEQTQRYAMDSNEFAYLWVQGTSCLFPWHFRKHEIGLKLQLWRYFELMKEQKFTCIC